MANFIKPVCLSAKMKPSSDTFGVHDNDFIKTVISAPCALITLFLKDKPIHKKGGTNHGYLPSVDANYQPFKRTISCRCSCLPQWRKTT
jgi:hypothetical protein